MRVTDTQREKDKNEMQPQISQGTRNISFRWWNLLCYFNSLLSERRQWTDGRVWPLWLPALRCTVLLPCKPIIGWRTGKSWRNFGHLYWLFLLFLSFFFSFVWLKKKLCLEGMHMIIRYWRIFSLVGRGRCLLGTYAYWNRQIPAHTWLDLWRHCLW